MDSKFLNPLAGVVTHDVSEIDNPEHKNKSVTSEDDVRHYRVSPDEVEKEFGRFFEPSQETKDDLATILDAINRIRNRHDMAFMMTLTTSAGALPDSVNGEDTYQQFGGKEVVDACLPGMDKTLVVCQGPASLTIVRGQDTAEAMTSLAMSSADTVLTPNALKSLFKKLPDSPEKMALILATSMGEAGLQILPDDLKLKLAYPIAQASIVNLRKAIAKSKGLTYPNSGECDCETCQAVLGESDETPESTDTNPSMPAVPPKHSTEDPSNG